MTAPTEEPTWITKIEQTVSLYDLDEVIRVFAPDVRDMIFDISITRKSWYLLGAPGTLTVTIEPASAPMRREKMKP